MDPQTLGALLEPVPMPRPDPRYGRLPIAPGTPLPVPQPAPVPVPRPDPRNWAERLPRIQNTDDMREPGRDVIPPEVLLWALGIDPGAKDKAIFDADQVMGQIVHKSKWQRDI